MSAPSISPTHFADVATAYAEDVVADRIPASNYHRLACQRHLDDLSRVEMGGWPYVWNPELTDTDGRTYRPAERICKFTQLMPHVKGEWAAKRQRIKLEPAQIFILASIFGWINTATGKRRYHEADVFIPRKNAKSALAACIGLYMLAADGEFGAEVYSGATSQDQALEVFRPALLMTRMTDSFRARYGVTPNASNISIGATNSKFEPLIGKPGDGASPSCAIVDEYHEHKTPELYDTMKTGMGARSQPLLLVITTAGADISGPCYQHQQELQKILEGLIVNERRFGIIFGLDEGDDPFDESLLAKSNPLLGVSINEEFLVAQLREARNDPRKQNVFKTKHHNIWVGAASPWLNLANLQACGDPTLRLERFAGKACVVGLDLASKVDIASAAFEFREEGPDGPDSDIYTTITFNYVPEDAVRKPENAHYQAWVNAGHLIQTPGNMISLSQIEDDIKAAQALYGISIAEVAKDPYGGQQLGANLAEEGFEVIDIPQQVRYLSEPMKDIAALIDAGRYRHDANPAFVWMLSNVECRPDRNENVFPRKARASNKIDAAVATIVAHSRSMVIAPQPVKSFWE